MRIVLAMVAMTVAWPALAHDLDAETSHWMSTLMTPDNPRVPCCGIADAYWADVVHVRDGKTFATITDERADGPLMRHHVPLGTQIEIPPQKLKYDAGNPTGHQIVFLNASNVALCFVQNGGF